MYQITEFRYNESMETLGARLRKLRGKLTQGQLQEFAGVAQSTYSDLERDEIHPKTLDVIIKLANYYRVSTDYILGLSNIVRSWDTPTLSVYDLEIARAIEDMTGSGKTGLLKIAELLREIERNQKEELVSDILGDVIESVENIIDEDAARKFGEALRQVALLGDKTALLNWFRRYFSGDDS